MFILFSSTPTFRCFVVPEVYYAKVTESLVKVVNEKQDKIEKRNSAQLDSLHEQPSILNRQLTPSATDVSKPPNQYPQPLQKQCDVCG